MNNVKIEKLCVFFILLTTVSENLKFYDISKLFFSLYNMRVEQISTIVRYLLRLHMVNQTNTRL